MTAEKEGGDKLPADRPSSRGPHPPHTLADGAAELKLTTHSLRYVAIPYGQYTLIINMWIFETEHGIAVCTL
jgi:hypothetical protein